MPGSDFWSVEVTEVRRRRRRAPRAKAPGQWLAQVPYAIVLFGAAAALALFATAHFRKGSALLAAAVLFGALARLVLPPSQAGLLATRARWLDALIMIALAVAVASVAWVVPAR